MCVTKVLLRQVLTHSSDDVLEACLHFLFGIHGLFLRNFFEEIHKQIVQISHVTFPTLHNVPEPNLLITWELLIKFSPPFVSIQNTRSNLGWGFGGDSNNFASFAEIRVSIIVQSMSFVDFQFIRV
jgi:hypothetical protein